MGKLKTNSGMLFQCPFLAEASVGVLYIILEQVSLSDAAAVFCREEEIGHLEYLEENGESRCYEGYTVVVSINRMHNGAVRLGIRRRYVGEDA